MEKIKTSYVGASGDTLLGFTYKTDLKEPLGNIIIVTGMAECAYRYDDFATFLTNNGYDVYCFDHYGQGENVTDLNQLGVVPKSFFSRSVKNLDKLVTTLRTSCLPTYIFGHSMGSFIVQDYIQRYTHHVNKVVICGSNGPNAKFLYWFGYHFARLLVHKKNRDKQGVFLNKLVMEPYSKSIKNRQSTNDWLSNIPEVVRAYDMDPKCGYIPSNGFFLELLKGNNRLYKKKFLKKIRPDMNILIVGGSLDPVGAKSRGLKSLAKLYIRLGVEHVETKIYPGARHEILNDTCSKEAYNDILDFLKADDGIAEIIQEKVKK